MFGTVTDDAVLEVAGQMLGVSNAAMRQFLAALVEVDQRELFRDDGAVSIEGWIALRYAASHATARSWVRVARGLVFCPDIAARFERNDLSWDQLVACIDLVAFAGLTDAEVAEDAVGRSAAELDRLAREARKVARTEAEERDRKRYLRLRWRRDGMLSGSFLLADAEGKAFEIAIRRGACDQPADPSSGLPRPIEERQADALADLSSVDLARDTDPDLATVVIHVDGAAIVDPTEDDALASIQLGPVVSRSTALRLCCDGRVQLVVDDERGETITVVRTEHAVPPWMRRTVLHRDGGCRFPGCGRTAVLHVHHIDWWSKGGLTEERNLCGLCRFHHRLVHEGGWSVRGDPFRRLEFVSPQGRVLEGGPPGLRDDVRDRLGLRYLGEPPLVAA
jgi:hypothetical protein